ncbi:MAG: phage protein Gp36 family protein [Candidatus Anammoxibacter sp.]
MYATVTDIEREFPNAGFASGNAKITNAAIQDFIRRESAFVNSYLHRYTLPITDDEVLDILRGLTIDLVGMRVAKALQTKSGLPPDDKGQVITEGTAYRAAIKYLQGLASGEIGLPGAVLKDVPKVQSANVNNNIEPHFQVEAEQW